MKCSHMLNYLAIAFGGALGALTRSFVYDWFAQSGNNRWYPLPTLTVNVVGSFLMGIAWCCLVEKSLLPPLWKDIISVGFLGALTTFSTFSLDVFRLLQSDRVAEALAYMLASITLCVLATWLGYRGINALLNG